MISGGPSSPASATAAPAAPPKRCPNTTEKLITFGPGKNCDSANTSLNSSAVIQPRLSTIMRRAQGSAPPKPDSETCTKARKSSLSEGRRAAGAGETESDMGGETYRADCRPASRVAAGRECVNRGGSPPGRDLLSFSPAGSGPCGDGTS